MKLREFKERGKFNITAVAPLDGKNVCVDWIYEVFMDDSAYGKNECLGYLGGVPLRTRWYDNVLHIIPLDGVTCLARAVVMDNLEMCIDYADESDYDHSEVLALYRETEKEWIVTFFWIDNE